MGSPITLSGFNQIDFNLILNAVMQQESLPLQVLQQRQRTLQTVDTGFGSLAGTLAGMRTAAGDLVGSSTLVGFAATSSDESAVSVAAAGASTPGHYEVVVSSLARSQVMASSSTAPDIDTTVVATEGTLTIGGVQVTVSGSVNLQELTVAINGTADIPVTASLVETAAGAFRMVLTAKDTGASHAFTVVNGLTLGGGSAPSSLTFADANGNGTSGDSALDNAVQATDASVLVNNIQITSGSNTLESGIPGVSVTLKKADPSNTVVVEVGEDEGSLTTRLQSFVDTYNDLVAFADAQSAASGVSAAHVSLMRGLRSSLRAALSGAYGAGTFTRLAEVGIVFTRTGQLELDEEALAEARSADRDGVTALLADSDSGAFAAIETLVDQYTSANGFVPDARERLSQEISRLDRRIVDMQDRLAIRRAALQREFAAADAIISRLNSQSGALASFGARLGSL